MDEPALTARPTYAALAELGTWGLAPLASLPDLTLPDADVAVVRPAPVRSSKRVWWDTPDLRLTAAGVTVVVEGDTWQLTTPGSSLTGKAVRGVPQQALDVLLARLGDATVAPVATVRQDVVPFELCSAEGDVVAVADDVSVSVLEGRRIAAKHRQLVLRGEPGSTARALVDVLTLTGLVPTDVRADLALALGSRAAPTALPTSLAPSSPAADVVVRALRDGHERLLEADLLVRLGKAKGLRKVRVALRRLRSDLATFAPLLGDLPPGLLDEMGTLSRTLGGARDLQVHRQRLWVAAEADPLLPVDADEVRALDGLLALQEQAAQVAATTALADSDYFDLVARLGALAAGPPLAPTASGTAAAALPPLALAAWKQLSRQVKRLEPLGEDETWHDVRKRCKQLRYACDAAAPALGDAPLHTSAQIARVQELLGEHQDAATTAAVLLDLVAGHPALGLTAGRLVERERTVVRRVRADLGALWDEVATPSTTGWFRP